MRILLTGSKGQVGQCFKNRLPEDWELIATDSKTLDITDTANVLNIVKNFEPDVVINAAAYTNVDKAEDNTDTAFAVNALGTENLALAAKAVGARFIHISTDYVFDGSIPHPVSEHQAPLPVNVYGHSKLAGELLALNAHIDTVIIRTSWVYSEYGHNFVKSILRRGLEDGILNIVSDQVGCPTYAGDIAQVLLEISAAPQFPRGLYHYSGKQRVSWYEFARQILVAADKHNPRYGEVTVNAITTADHPTPARRPPYTVLDTQRLHEILPRPVTETPLQTTIDRLLA